MDSSSSTYQKRSHMFFGTLPFVLNEIIVKLIIYLLKYLIVITKLQL